MSGSASAHFPLNLDIDIQPNNAMNFIDIEEHDTVSVAVHRSTFLNHDGEEQTFDPTTEVVRYRFGSRFAVQNGNGARQQGTGEIIQVEDGDGNTNEALLLEFPVRDMEFDGNEETGWLYWERTASGNHGYKGVDSVRIYGSPTPTTGRFPRLRRILQSGEETEKRDTDSQDD
jgi:hypothetical protein